jgi:hypothetical protein
MKGNNMRRNLKLILTMGVMVMALSALSCAHNPPPLSPAGTTAFQNQQIQRALDAIRDVAIEANATTPPLLATGTARQVVEWHQTVLVILHARSSGWQAAVLTTIDELQKQLPPQAIDVLRPYFALAKAVLQEVIK